MKVSEKDVLYAASLVNLELTAEERARFAQDLNSILGYIDRLNELDTSGVPPMTQVTGRDRSPEETGGASSAYPWRPDDVLPSLSREAALQNAPEANDSFFKVPKVMER